MRAGVRVSLAVIVWTPGSFKRRVTRALNVWAPKSVGTKVYVTGVNVASLLLTRTVPV